LRKIFTIGFAGKNAETFFNILRNNNIRLIVDIRLNNVSQLAGFTKASDLPFFLREIIDAAYLHYPLLAPPAELLKDYRGAKLDWDAYESRYLAKLKDPALRKQLKIDIPDWKQPFCLLCSEPTADHCHRRLAAQYLAKLLKIKEIVHL
jgi:uncharacterized protein (DUF488 family)